MRQLICLGLNVYLLILLVRIILSWVPRLPEPIQPVARFAGKLTDPLLLPLRRVLPPVQLGALALDLSPLVLWFGIIILKGLICR